MGDQLLMWSVENGSIEQAHLLLLRKQASPNKPNVNGTTPLHVAARSGHLTMTNLLLKNGASCDVHEHMQIGGNTPLHLATENDHLEVMTALLDAGADPSSQNSLGHSPLHVAAMEGLLLGAKLLMVRGGDPNLRDFGGKNPAAWAQELRQLSVLQYFESQGVQPRKISQQESWDHTKAVCARLNMKEPKPRLKKKKAAEGKAKGGKKK
mmetsp:Transcript_40196/g.87692  ORF Transcript_40196/g.87692 Transcript_40196/m.87692 type:complete len:209 (+) Transcript_40196:47-673(+)